MVQHSRTPEPKYIGCQGKRVSAKVPLNRQNIKSEPTYENGRHRGRWVWAAGAVLLCCGTLPRSCSGETPDDDVDGYGEDVCLCPIFIKGGFVSSINVLARAKPCYVLSNMR